MGHSLWELVDPARQLAKRVKNQVKRRWTEPEEEKAEETEFTALQPGGPGPTAGERWDEDLHVGSAAGEAQALRDSRARWRGGSL